MTIGEVFSMFIDSRILKGCKETTVCDYKNQLLRFMRYAGVNRDISEVSKELVNNYIKSIVQSDLGKGTKSTYVRCLRIFLTFAYKKGYVEFNSEEITVPKNPKKQVRIYTKDEIQTLLIAAETSVPWITMRNRAIIALMYDSGLRQGECCSILVKNVQHTVRRIKVSGKGDKERFVTYGNVTEQFIRRYMEMCPYELQDALFVTDEGGAISTMTIKCFMADIQEKVPFDVSSHKLRHNFATNWLIDDFEKNGKFDLTMLQYKMGHESSETTKMYLHFAMGEIASRSGTSHLDSLELTV